MMIEQLAAVLGYCERAARTELPQIPYHLCNLHLKASRSNLRLPSEQGIMKASCIVRQLVGGLRFLYTVLDVRTHGGYQRADDGGNRTATTHVMPPMPPSSELILASLAPWRATARRNRFPGPQWAPLAWLFAKLVGSLRAHVTSAIHRAFFPT